MWGRSQTHRCFPWPGGGRAVFQKSLEMPPCSNISHLQDRLDHPFKPVHTNPVFPTVQTDMQTNVISLHSGYMYEKTTFIEHMDRTGAGNKERPLSPPVKHMKQKEHMKQNPPCETMCSTDHCVSNWTDPVLWQDLPAVRASVRIKPSCDINHLPPS